MFVLSRALYNIFDTPVARYSLTVLNLKVPLNTNHPTNQPVPCPVMAMVWHMVGHTSQPVNIAYIEPG